MSWPRRDLDWPGNAWPGYFSRTLLHHVDLADSERLSRTLGLAECGAVAVRPQAGTGYTWCQPCKRCFPGDVADREE